MLRLVKPGGARLVEVRLRQAIEFVVIVVSARGRKVVDVKQAR
jgi:hypothetical protein